MTKQLFEDQPLNHGLKELFAHVVDRPLPVQVHDTQEIMDIYMQRPRSLTWQSLGLWFAKAHCLKTKLGRGMESDALGEFGMFTIQTRRFMVEHKLTHLPLEPLLAYNKAWTDKEKAK
jgi:hypothetical protein